MWERIDNSEWQKAHYKIATDAGHPRRVSRILKGITGKTNIPITYVISDGNTCKIGKTKQTLSIRASQLVSARYFSYEELVVKAIFEGTELEKLLHRYLKNSQIDHWGIEFFDLTSEKIVDAAEKRFNQKPLYQLLC